MGSPVYPTQQYIERLTALNAADYVVAPNQAQCRLFKNNVEPDALMNVDTFVEADFVGYGAVPLTMSTPSMNDQGLIVSKTNLCSFNCDEGAENQPVYGIYITDKDSLKVIAAQRFDEPQNMGGPYPTAVNGVWRTSEPLTTYGWIDVEG